MAMSETFVFHKEKPFFQYKLFLRLAKSFKSLSLINIRDKNPFVSPLSNLQSLIDTNINSTEILYFLKIFNVSTTLHKLVSMILTIDDNSEHDQLRNLFKK